MPEGTGRAEHRVHDQSPGACHGRSDVARGKVVKAGRTLTVAQSEVFAESGGQEKLVALLTGTLMTVEARDGISD
jgi:acyl-coenzyme A thioesterase PaaI-like protein